jgi:hypothetical protein
MRSRSTDELGRIAAAMSRYVVRAAVLATEFAFALGVLIVIGSRNLHQFDAALVGYTFATLFATWGITYRYAMWLQRPPTRMYWRRGWRAFVRRLPGNLVRGMKRALVDVAANRFIWRRDRMRGLTHLSIMWGCFVAAAITFPLVWGWIHFETVHGQLDTYRAYLFGYAAGEFAADSALAFVAFHGLVWASLLVLFGVMLAFRRRMRDRGAEAVQMFGEDMLPLVLLAAISVTGLMLTVSYTWLHGYAYSFLALLHAITVIVTLLWLPFGKFFHIFQRPAQLGVGFYKDEGARGEQAKCRRCNKPFASVQMIRDLVTVERELGFRYEMAGGHYQEVCPACRRALFGLAQSARWTEST